MLESAHTAFDQAVTALLRELELGIASPSLDRDAIAAPFIMSLSECETLASGARIDRRADVDAHLCVFRRRSETTTWDLAFALPPFAAPTQVATSLKAYLGLDAPEGGGAADKLGILRAICAHGERHDDILVLSLDALRDAVAPAGLPLSIVLP